MVANACVASAFNRPLLSISSATSSSVTFSSAPSSARICSSNGKIFSSCSFKLAFHFSSSAFPMAAYSSWRRSPASSMTFVRYTRWPALTFLLDILFSRYPARRTRFCGIFHCVRNISALAGPTKHSGLYLSFSPLYCSHTFVHHNHSNQSVLILQCSLVLLLPRVNALTT